MARKTSEELEKIKKKYNTDRLWSFSRVNCYVTCKYSYYLKYVKNEKEVGSSIYSVLGGQFHDILEAFYEKKIPYEQMSDEANVAIMNASIQEMIFE